MVFIMATRIMHSYETKMKVIELKLQGVPNKRIQHELGIKNITQIKTWWRWYRNGEIHRLSQPVGKQYSYGKAPEGSTPEETLNLQIKSLKQQVELLKKYKEKERLWLKKLL